MNGTSFIDFILLVIFIAFIVSRFMSHKLPKDDKNKKNIQSQQKKHGQPRTTSKGNSQENVVTLGQRPARKSTFQPEKISQEELEKIKGVDKIRAVDPTFNEAEFKDGAKQAFMLYWQAVAEKDEETLQNLLAPRLFDSTMDTIDTLEDAGKHRVTRIDKFDDLEIVDTRVNGLTALIDLKYTVTWAQSDVKNDTTSTQAQAKTTRTVWTLARNLSDEDPNWELEDIKPVN